MEREDWSSPIRLATMPSPRVQPAFEAHCQNVFALLHGNLLHRRLPGTPNTLCTMLKGRRKNETTFVQLENL